jgi:hypothetical protein
MKRLNKTVGLVGAHGAWLSSVSDAAKLMKLRENTIKVAN